MAKTKGVRQVFVIQIQVDVLPDGTLGNGRVMLTDADNYDHVGVKEFPSVAHAIDDVFYMLLKTKMQQGMGDALMNQRGGNA